MLLISKLDRTGFRLTKEVSRHFGTTISNKMTFIELTSRTHLDDHSIIRKRSFGKAETSKSLRIARMFQIVSELINVRHWTS